MYKKSGIVSFLLLIIALVILTNCETDINVEILNEDIPVVFGLIDLEDDEYLISITKTFNGNLMDYGLESLNDNYYDTLIVTLELRINPEINRRSPGHYWDNWMDLYEPYGELIIRKELTPKLVTNPETSRTRKLYALSSDEFVSPGIFGLQLRNDIFLRLVVQKPGTQIYSVASTLICFKPYLLSPGNGTSMSLFDNEVEWTWDAHGNYSEPKITVHYQEYMNDEWKDKSFTWDFKSFDEKEIDVGGGSKYTVYSGYPFNERILAHLGRIEDNSNVKARKLISYDLVVYNASPIYEQYIESEKIVSDQIGQPISNVVNGLGIFSSCSKAGKYGFTLDQRGMDSLINGRYTKHLKFVKW